MQQIVENVPSPETRLAQLEEENARLAADLSLLKQLYVKAPFAYQSLDDGGCLLDVNQEWLDTLRYTREEVIGKNFSEFLHPDWQDHFKDNFPQFKAVGEILGVEFEMIAKDGSLVQVAFDGKIAKDLTGRFQRTHCVFQNITRQKQIHETRQALGESKARLNLTQESANIGLWELNVETGALDFSPQLNKLYGLPPGGIKTYQDWLERVHPDDRKRIFAVRDEALRKNEAYEVEYRIRHAYGTYRWLASKAGPVCNAAGKITRLIGVNIDITDRVKVQDALVESEERFRTMINAMPQMAFITRPDGSVFWYNDRWYEYTGKTPEQMEGWGWQSVHDPEVLPMVMERWQAAIAAEEPIEITLPLRGADGVFRPFLTRILPLKDAAGTVQRWVGTNTDISKIKRLEAERQASLAEKEVMLREIHHRVKNNLQVVSSLISLQQGNMTDERIITELNNVRDRIQSMALVHEKLYQTGDLTRLNFADYINSLLHYLWRSHSTVAADVRLRQSLDAVPLTIEAAIPCGQILNELVVNALKHAFIHGRGGEIFVGLAQDPKAGTITLSVKDDGVGLPQDLDWKQPSTLGLRLVHILTRQLGGTAEKGEGPGTEFTISFGRDY